MLARRFTIVCILTAMFGMGLAILVAEAGRGERAMTFGAESCAFSTSVDCTLRQMR